MEISRSTGLRVFEPGIVLEGGSIDVNGKGTLITTEQCLLNANRNPHLGKGGIERHLRDYLGVREIVWLGQGIAGDDTDGHVDDVARFVNENTVVCMVEEDENDENHIALKRNYEVLSKHRGRDGQGFQMVAIAMPRVMMSDGRLPASYANFYIGNSAVLLPVFGDKSDEKATSIIADLFPSRAVVPLDCRDLVYGFGGIHCVTQQQPAS